jgi:AcrR family transcriptional regulator
MSEVSASRKGRPRNSLIDDRALEATRHLLLEDGYEATTIPKVAERAGLHTSAFYRRWPSRVELIQDAAFGNLAPRRVRPTGDLRRDLIRFLQAYVSTLKTPLHRAALPALVGPEARNHPRTPEAWSEISIRPHFQKILAAARSTPIDPGIDPDEIFDLVLGAALVHAFVPPQARTPVAIEQTVDLIMRILTTEPQPMPHACTLAHPGRGPN